LSACVTDHLIENWNSANADIFYGKVGDFYSCPGGRAAAARPVVTSGTYL